MIYISDLLIQSLFSFFTLTTRDHLCSYEGTICAQFILADFFARVQGGFNFVFESESCIFLFFFLAKLSCMCVSVFFLCRCFQVRHLDWLFCFYSCPSPTTGQRGETVRVYLGGQFTRWRRWASFNHFCHSASQHFPVRALPALSS